jgi:SAM-dependent methyltransferase
MRLCSRCGAPHDRSDWMCPACGASPVAREGILRFPAAHADGHRDADYRFGDLTDAEPWHFWFRSRRRLVVRALRRHFPGMRSLLDVGCGTGFVLEGVRHQCPGVRLAGCDITIEALARGKQRLPDVFWFEAFADSLPFEEEFDVVTALDVLEHVDRDEESLSALFRAIVPGGGLVVTVPQHPWLWSAVDDFSCHRRRYTRSELLRKARAAGFDIVRCTSCFTLTLPAVVASRLLSRRGAFDPAAELRLPRVLNACLNVLQECESWLIEIGLSLPVGSSLLMVARRPPA